MFAKISLCLIAKIFDFFFLKNQIKYLINKNKNKNKNNKIIKIKIKTFFNVFFIFFKFFLIFFKENDIYIYINKNKKN